MPKTPSSRPVDRYCVQCEALVLFPDLQVCKFCNGRLTSKKLLRGASSRASTLERKQRAVRGGGSGGEPTRPVSGGWVVEVIGKMPDRPSARSKCEICNNQPKKGSKRCRPCANKPALRPARPKVPAPSKASPNLPPNSPLCVRCGRLPKSGPAYCASCTARAKETPRQSQRTGEPAAAVWVDAKGIVRMRTRRKSVPGESPTPEPVKPRVVRRTTGPIKTRTYTPPENDPRITNEYARGMRGRPAGEFGD